MIRNRYYSYLRHEGRYNALKTELSTTNLIEMPQMEMATLKAELSPTNPIEMMTMMMPKLEIPTMENSKLTAPSNQIDIHPQEMTMPRSETPAMDNFITLINNRLDYLTTLLVTVSEEISSLRAILSMV